MMKQLCLVLLAPSAAQADLPLGGEHSHNHLHLHQAQHQAQPLAFQNSLTQGFVFPRDGRQQEDEAVQGGFDFSSCVEDPETGLCCVDKEETVTSLEKEPILECTHKNTEQCHYTYVTQFKPTQEEVCEENFEKLCSITFKQQAYNETVNKCYKPVEKVCNGQGPEECRTVYESSCSTKYVEKQPGKFVGDTACEKLPIEICGAGCTFEEEEQECHDKVIASLVDVPEEVCDLNPQKTCRFVTKLVPSLSPEHQCTIVPKETCILKFTQPRQVPKPLQTRWCLDPTPAAPGELYDEAGESDRSSGLGADLGAALELPLRTARRATWRK